MGKRLDLHTHSNRSDGDFEPEMVVEEAVKKNIDILALTDHDTVKGVQRLYPIINELPLSLIPGIELSAYIAEGRFHILGLGINPFNKELVEATRETEQKSINKIRDVIKYLEERYGTINNPFFKDKDDINKLYHPIGDVGRRDVAKLLIKYGYVKDDNEAFDIYLNDAKDHINMRDFLLRPEDCIKLINGADGIAIVAHSITLKKDMQTLSIYYQRLKEYGLEGIEVGHYKHDRSYQKALLKMLEDNNLSSFYTTDGSDFHGPTKPEAPLGIIKTEYLPILDDPRIKQYIKKPIM